MKKVMRVEIKYKNITYHIAIIKESDYNIVIHQNKKEIINRREKVLPSPDDLFGMIHSFLNPTTRATKRFANDK